MESTTTVGESPQLQYSLFDAKDDFIDRIAPIGVAAIYFGMFSLSPLALAGRNRVLSDGESQSD
jgi:hypothetical protein